MSKKEQDFETRTKWCENFIKAAFKKCGGCKAIYTGCFWDLAEESGLWVRGTYGTPMSEALSRLTTVEAVQDKDGNFLFHTFKLKEQEVTRC